MNQRQAAAQVSEVAIWARETATEQAGMPDSAGRHVAWVDLADAADDLAAMIERDTFAAPGG